MRKKLITILIVLVVLLGAGLIAYAILWPGLEEKMEANRELAKENYEAAGNTTGVTQDGSMSYDAEKWQEGTITYNGKNYKYNANVKAYLFLGIDSDDPVSAAPDYVSGGQSDAIFLLVDDPDNKKFSVVAVHRNTMTEIEIFDETGKSLGKQEGQICLQHGYGDGMKISCRLSEEAVSHLFYNIPISGYMSIQMGAIGYMNDAVGGVEVQVLDDLTDTGRGVNLVKGTTVKLTADEAYVYLRSRDNDEFDSSSTRLERQKQWLTQFFNQVKIATSTQWNTMFDNLDPYIVYNFSFASLASSVADYSMEMYTVKGETVLGSDGFEEHYIDDDDLYDLIINLFYKEVE